MRSNSTDRGGSRDYTDICQGILGNMTDEDAVQMGGRRFLEVPYNIFSNYSVPLCHDIAKNLTASPNSNVVNLSTMKSFSPSLFSKSLAGCKGSALARRRHHSMSRLPARSGLRLRRGLHWRPAPLKSPSKCPRNFIALNLLNLNRFGSSIP